MGHVPDFDHLKNLQNGQRMDIQSDVSRRAQNQSAQNREPNNNNWSSKPNHIGYNSTSVAASAPTASSDDSLKRDGWGQGHKARKNTDEPVFTEQVPVRPPDRPVINTPQAEPTPQNIPHQIQQPQTQPVHTETTGAKGPSQAEIAAASRELQQQMQQQAQQQIQHQEVAEPAAKAPERKPAQNPRRTLNALVSAMNPAQIAQAKAAEAAQMGQTGAATPFPAAPEVTSQRSPGVQTNAAQSEAPLSAAEKLQIQAANLPPHLAQLHQQILEAQAKPAVAPAPIEPAVAHAQAPVEPAPQPYIPAQPSPLPYSPQQPAAEPYIAPQQPAPEPYIAAPQPAPHTTPAPPPKEPWELAAQANPQPAQPPWDKVESTAVPAQFAAREPWELASNVQGAQVTHAQIFQQPVSNEPVLPSPDTPAGHYLKFLQNNQSTDRPVLSAQSALANTAQPESRAFEVQPLDTKAPSPVEIQRSSHLNLRVESINPEPPKPAPETSRLLSLIFTDNDPFEAANCSQTFRIDTVSGIKTMTTMLPDNSSTRIECTREDGCKTITISENLRSATAISARPLCVRDMDSQGNITSETKYNYHNVNDLCTPTSKKVITGGQVIQFNLDQAGRVVSQIILPPDQG